MDAFDVLSKDIAEVKRLAENTQKELEQLIPQISSMLAGYTEWKRRVDDDRAEFKKEFAEMREQNKVRDRILYGIMGGFVVVQVLLKYVIH